MNRALSTYVVAGALVGAAVPLCLWWMASMTPMGPNVPEQSWAAWDYLALLVWPTPWLLFSHAELDAAGARFIAVAIAANTVLYGVLGAMLWRAVTSSMRMLWMPAVLLLVVWYAAWPG